MEQYRMFELAFRGEEPKGSQAVIQLEAVFSLIGENSGEVKSKNHERSNH